MRKKLIIATLLPMLVLPLSSELSYSQPVTKQVVVQQNVYNQTVFKQVEKQERQERQEYMIFEATAYDLSIQCCGKPYSSPSRGITRSGHDLNNKSHSDAWTVSSNKFPMGTKLFLEFPDTHKQYDGIYVVHDTGNFKDNVIDVFLGDFGEKVGQETIIFGRVEVKVKEIE